MAKDEELEKRIKALELEQENTKFENQKMKRQKNNDYFFLIGATLFIAVVFLFINVPTPNTNANAIGISIIGFAIMAFIRAIYKY